MNKKIIGLISFAGMIIPTALVFAQVTLTSMASTIAGQVIIVGTWIVVIMWVVTGILFLTAGGEPGKLNTAKLAVFAAIGGTILILLAHIAVSFVANSFGLSTS